MNNNKQKILSIAEYAKKNKSFKFTCLAHLLDVDFLHDCYFSLNRNKAVGIDGVSWREYGLKLNNNLNALVNKIKAKKFKPLPARLVYIAKNTKEYRPLRISTLENKIVERGITKILGAIYETDFLDCSFGFRPNRNSHQALNKLNNLLTTQSINHIVKADIKGFFDNVSHEFMMSFLKIRISDPILLELIEKILKMGYLYNGLLVKPNTGTAQGGCLSPLLANIFLHYVLDEWFENIVKTHTRGFCELVRYADDFICVVRYADDAARLERGLKNRLNKYGLKLHPDKSRCFSFGKYEIENSRRQKRPSHKFDFLGFTHYCDETKSGKFKVGLKTSRKKLWVKCREINSWLKTVKDQINIECWWKILASKLIGHIQYYGVSENFQSVKRFYRVILRLIFKWLNRRNKKCEISWEQFNKYLTIYPLPKPKIVNSFCSLV